MSMWNPRHVRAPSPLPLLFAAPPVPIRTFWSGRMRYGVLAQTPGAGPGEEAPQTRKLAARCRIRESVY